MKMYGKYECVRPLAFESLFSVFHSFKVKCGGYLDKIYKILADILDLKAGFPLAFYFIRSDVFRSKTIKSRIGFYFLYLEKSC